MAYSNRRYGRYTKRRPTASRKIASLVKQIVKLSAKAKRPRRSRY